VPRSSQVKNGLGSSWLPNTEQGREFRDKVQQYTTKKIVRTLQLNQDKLVPPKLAQQHSAAQIPCLHDADLQRN
jgi:hypothetical protein